MPFVTQRRNAQDVYHLSQWAPKGPIHIFILMMQEHPDFIFTYHFFPQCETVPLKNKEKCPETVHP